MKAESKGQYAGLSRPKGVSISLQIGDGGFQRDKSFPKDERYSLTDQIRRSSRSVDANNAEAYRKGQYSKMFASKLAESDGETIETQVWLDFACGCGYFFTERHDELKKSCEEVGKMLVSMMAHPEKFAPSGIN